MPAPAVALMVPDGGEPAALTAIFSDLGFDTVVRADTALAVIQGQVRYFRDTDAALAKALANRAGYRLLDLTWYLPQPSPPHIEMRMPVPDGAG